MAGSSNHSLVESAAAGDRRALEALWRSHRRWVAAILLAHRPAGEDLEDLLQEVALRVVSRIGELRDPGSFRAWLRSVALNVARARGRQISRRPRSGPLEAEPVHVGASGIEEVDRRDERERILEALQSLPHEFREPLVLRCLHQMSQRRIAEELGIPETTVETRLARGRRKLRERLSPMTLQDDKES